MAMTEAQLRSQARYQKRIITQVLVKLHRENDADIIAKLDPVGSKNGYIKQLIRQDIALHGGTTTPPGPRDREQPREQDE